MLSTAVLKYMQLLKCSLAPVLGAKFAMKPTGCLRMQRLEEALAEEVAPNSKYLSRLTEVSGFDPEDKVVEMAAGYMVWTALTASGKAYVCGTGFDGYGGSLPDTVRHGGWAAVEQV